MINLYEMLDLQLFAGEGAGDGAGEGSTEAGVNMGQEAAVPAGRRARREDPFANTVFGRVDNEQSQAAADTTDEAAPAEETFEQLTGKGGKHEKAFNDAVQKILRRRLGDQNKLKGQLDSQQPIMQLLAQRYNIQADDPAAIDPAALLSALEEDRRYYEDRAYREGVSVETLMREDRINRQQAALDARRNAEQQEAQMRREFASLQQQAVAMQAVNPDFDLEREMDNPAFMRLVRSGTPVETAYFATHHREIMENQRRQQLQQTHAAVQQARQMTASAIASGSGRPVENGSVSTAPATHITDPTKLTREQRQEIRKRVSRGERIVW